MRCVRGRLCPPHWATRPRAILCSLRSQATASADWDANTSARHLLLRLCPDLGRNRRRAQGARRCHLRAGGPLRRGRPSPAAARRLGRQRVGPSSWLRRAHRSVSSRSASAVSWIPSSACASVPAPLIPEVALAEFPPSLSPHCPPMGSVSRFGRWRVATDPAGLPSPHSCRKGSSATNLASFSMTVTLAPAWWASSAAERPARPDPTTMTCAASAQPPWLNGPCAPGRGSASGHEYAPEAI